MIPVTLVFMSCEGREEVDQVLPSIPHAEDHIFDGDRRFRVCQVQYHLNEAKIVVLCAIV